MSFLNSFSKKASNTRNVAPQLTNARMQAPLQSTPILNSDSGNNLIFDDDDPLPVAAASAPKKAAAAAADQPGEASPAGHVTVTVTPEYSAYNKDKEANVLISLSAHASDPSAAPASTDAAPVARPGVDIVCVIDKSGSMNQQGKMANVIKTMEFIVDSLADGDRVSMTLFDSRAERILKLTRLNEAGKAATKTVIAKLRAGGGTSISSGLNAGFATIGSRKHVNSVCGVFLLTDGLDGTNIATVKQLLENYDLTGVIPVHTMAFGADHNAALLKDIAETTLGTYSFIEDAESVSDAVAPALGGLLSMVAKKVEIKLNIAPKDVKIVELETGAYKKTIDGNSSAVIAAGDCYDGENRKFLLTVKTANSPTEIALDVSYIDPNTDEKQTTSTSAVLDFSENNDEVKQNSDVAEFMLNILVKKALKNATASIGANQMDKAKEIMDSALDMVKNYPGSFPEERRAAMISDLEEAKKDILDAAKSRDSGMQKKAFAAFNMRHQEMEVQRAGLNAMKKSAYSKAAYSTKKQEATSESADRFWNKKS